MKIEWKEQGGPDVEAARVIANLMGMCVEVEHLCHLWCWTIYVTTADDCQEAETGHEETIDAAKHAVEARVVEILTGLRAQIDAAIGEAPDRGHSLTVERVSNGRVTLRSEDEQGLRAIEAMAAGDVVRVRGAEKA